ncbi:MAG TPA: hypothetical protein DIT05_18660 [Morganella sp. (in: Bacteria)]|nr:hypothetical protein [Morganella sp. (in: enterobacteria)]
MRASLREKIITVCNDKISKKGENVGIPLFIQTAGSLAAVSQPGHILMYAPRLSSLAACLHFE